MTELTDEEREEFHRLSLGYRLDLFQKGIMVRDPLYWIVPSKDLLEFLRKETKLNG